MCRIMLLSYFCHLRLRHAGLRPAGVTNRLGDIAAESGWLQKSEREKLHCGGRETCVRRLRVTVYGIILPFARGCRVGV